MRATVLLVDDDESFAEAIEIALQSIEEITVVVLANGIEAIKFLAQHTASLAALITDLHMPFMDGFELIDKIRTHDSYRSLPIIVVTGDSNPETPSRLKGLEITAYFQKPCSPLQIRRKIQVILSGVLDQESSGGGYR